MGEEKDCENRVMREYEDRFTEDEKALLDFHGISVMTALGYDPRFNADDIADLCEDYSCPPAEANAYHKSLNNKEIKGLVAKGIKPEEINPHLDEVYK